MCLYTYVLSHEWKVSALIAKSTPDVFVDFRPPYWWTKVVHQHGDSIQNPIKLRATLRQITQKRCIKQTWNLERLLMYWSSTTFSCSWLFSLNGFEFNFFMALQWKRSMGSLSTRTFQGDAVVKSAKARDSRRGSRAKFNLLSTSTARLGGLHSQILAC